MTLDEYEFNICEFNEFIDRNLGKKKKEMKLSHIKTTSDWNPTFMIGDPMRKVHMGKTSHLLVILALNGFVIFLVF